MIDFIGFMFVVVTLISVFFAAIFAHRYISARYNEYEEQRRNEFRKKMRKLYRDQYF